jgi:hypothetical protein
VGERSHFVGFRTRIAAHFPFPRSLALRSDGRLLSTGQLRRGSHHSRSIFRLELGEAFYSFLGFSIETGAAVSKTLRLCKKRQDREQKMRGNSQLMRRRPAIDDAKLS